MSHVGLDRADDETNASRERDPLPALSVVLPTWNEAPNLEALLGPLGEVLGRVVERWEVIVVDAGSSDGTQEVAARFGARVFEQEEPGYGGALRTGFRHARAPFVLTLDADLSHPPAFIERMWQAREEADLVIASRYVPGGRARMPRTRLALSWTLNTVFSEVLGLGVRDLSSGFRLYRRAVLERIESTSAHFDVLQQLLLGVIEQGGRVREVPFHYEPRVHGASHARVLAFGWAYARLLVSTWLLRSRWLSGAAASRKAPYLIALLTLTLFAHLPGLGGGALFWDDDELVFRNDALARLDTKTLVRIFDPSIDRKAFGSQYTPLSDLSYALDRALWGERVWFYHLENLGWHLLVVLSAFWLVHAAGGNALAALMAAGLVGLHPVSVEAVAWISGRRSAMACAFVLLAVYAAMRALEPGRRARLWAVASLGFAWLADLSKQFAVALPVLVLALALAKRKSEERRANGRRAPARLVVLHALLALFFVWLGLVVGRREGVIAAGELDPLAALGSVLLALPRYAAMLLWPVCLRPSYAIRYASALEWKLHLVFGALILLGVLVLLWRTRCTKPWLAATTLSALAVLAPALAPGRPQFVADRYLYPALVWIGAALGFGLTRWVGGQAAVEDRKTKAAWERSVVVRRALLAVSLCVIAVLLTARSARQSRIWKNDLSLWEHTVRCDRNNPVALRMYALALWRAHRFEEAQAALEQALGGIEELADRRARWVAPAIMRELARLLEARGRYEQAASWRARAEARERSSAP